MDRGARSHAGFGFAQVPRGGIGCVLGLHWLLAGCGIEIPPPSYVDVTELAAIRHSVELGSLHPERVGPLFEYDDEMPIAEILPGDRLLLDAIVIDVEGLRLPAEEVETLWLQCGVGPCARSVDGFVDARFDVPCSELAVLSEYTTDSYCLLGTGSAQFEFVIPEIGPDVAHDPRTHSYPRMSFYGVVAWDGRRATDCWAQRRGDKAQLDRCAFIFHNVTVGPVWWMLIYAESIGLNFTAYDPDLLPARMLEMPANRIPRAPELTILVDGEIAAQSRVPLQAVAVPPGAQIEIRLVFDSASQQLQAFVPAELLTHDLVPELVLSRTLTTGAIRRIGEELPVVGDGSFDYRVDPVTPPGISRVLIGYRDNRGANDIITVEFEVE